MQEASFLIMHSSSSGKYLPKLAAEKYINTWMRLWLLNYLDTFIGYFRYKYRYRNKIMIRTSFWIHYFLLIISHFLLTISSIIFLGTLSLGFFHEPTFLIMFSASSGVFKVFTFRFSSKPAKVCCRKIYQKLYKLCIYIYILYILRNIGRNAHKWFHEASYLIMFCFLLFLLKLAAEKYIKTWMRLWLLNYSKQATFYVVWISSTIVSIRGGLSSSLSDEYLLLKMTLIWTFLIWRKEYCPWYVVCVHFRVGNIMIAFK